MSNAINPEHYNRLNPQPKDVIRAWGLNFNYGYTEVHITGNANPIEVREYIERELKDRLAMVL